MSLSTVEKKLERLSARIDECQDMIEHYQKDPNPQVRSRCLRVWREKEASAFKAYFTYIMSNEDC